eukprot:TRINITY_DN12046_c0_g1_i2.p2 TRINITY_DN12046_c0_g1~~TRINITY_DN12046_c0_g1_i2.p2  ORF type:complete len:119 (+),score=29.10 TRINITY_DN12046_c0_g1_i2:247-603(+)
MEVRRPFEELYYEDPDYRAFQPDPHEFIPVGLTPLMHAAIYGDLETVKVLVEMGANMMSHDEDGLTALELARMQHNHSVVAYLELAAAEKECAAGLEALNSAPALGGVPMKPRRRVQL